MRATRRTFKVNLIKKKVDIGDGVFVTMKISSRMYKKYKTML